MLIVWAKCIGGLAIAKVISMADPTGLLAGNLAGVAAFLFIALPDRKLRDRGETWDAYGLPWWGWQDRRSWAAWGRGFLEGALICAIVFPLFFFAYRAFVELLPHLPPEISELLAPYVGRAEFRFALPERLWLLIINQIFVVALPEELFYRGYLQTTWKATAPHRKTRMLGATLGAGFLTTQILFAVGHLVILQFWRLGTFFPGLLFGWLRERKGDITTCVAVHAFSNIYMAILEESFFRN